MKFLKRRYLKGKLKKTAGKFITIGGRTRINGNFYHKQFRVVRQLRKKGMRNLVTVQLVKEKEFRSIAIESVAYFIFKKHITYICD